MSKINRVFLIILDSLGVGALPDAADYGDEGCNTLRSCFETGKLNIPTLQKLGIFNIDGIDFGEGFFSPKGAYGKMNEASAGKDTTVGHWEIAGIISKSPLPTYPNGFPADLISLFEEKTGYRALCNKPYSGTEVIRDYGEKHLSGDKNVIVYTSADSVFQVAAHTDKVPIEELYRICKIARDMLSGEHGVGRVIARPFNGEFPFTRTAQRHDYSISPPRETILNLLEDVGLSVIGIGKIEDIFAGSGVTHSILAKSNADGMKQIEAQLKEDFSGLCFTNLVDFDMIFGHRNNADGYANALNEFDSWLCEALPLLRDDDILMITADHGCDPGAPGTDHTREYVPILVYGKKVKQGVNLGIRGSFADIAKTIADLFEINAPSLDGARFTDVIT